MGGGCILIFLLLTNGCGSPKSLVRGFAYHQNKINIPGILFEMKESLTLPFHRQAGRTMDAKWQGLDGWVNILQRTAILSWV